MKFVDRNEEQRRLRRAIESDMAQFIVIYGRRRLGKSTLVKKVLNERDLYFMADNSEQNRQRELLAQLLADSYPGFDKVNYPSWESLFEHLDMRCEKGTTLCLDEFPYMVKTCPELPSILQKIVDRKERKYHLILCGSSQRMMQKLVLDASDPLYGRADVILKLGFIPYPYLQEVLDIDAVQAVEEYSVWGGVPRYWELRNKEDNLLEAIRYNMLSTNGTLYEEPMRLFMDDLTQSTQSETIMSVIGNGCNRLSEIAARLGKKATDLGNPLNKLIQLGYIERELPFNENLKNSKKSIYRIADPFMDFYYRFIIPNRSLIGLGHVKRVEQRIIVEFPRYVSLHWEKICRDSISGNELFGHVWDIAARWWGNVSETERIELDVVALSEDKKHLLVGECKWTEKENSEILMKQLVEKASKLPFAKNKEIVPVLFLKHPPLDNGKENILLPEAVAQLNCRL